MVEGGGSGSPHGDRGAESTLQREMCPKAWPQAQLLRPHRHLGDYSVLPSGLQPLVGSRLKPVLPQPSCRASHLGFGDTSHQTPGAARAACAPPLQLLLLGRVLSWAVHGPVGPSALFAGGLQFCLAGCSAQSQGWAGTAQAPRETHGSPDRAVGAAGRGLRVRTNRTVQCGMCASAGERLVPRAREPSYVPRGSGQCAMLGPWSFPQSQCPQAERWC